MAHTHATLTALRRPRLLISAARFGVAQYDRDAVLTRIFGERIPAPGESCLGRLLDHEVGLDAARRHGLHTYSIADHIDALVAILAESRLLGDADRVGAAVPSAEGCDVVPPRRAEALS